MLSKATMSSPNPSRDSFDQYDDQWDHTTKTYDESYIHYTIEWKMTVNNRAKKPKHTEQAIVVAPAAYWQHFLEP